jgi:hypothetical protein
MMKRCSPIWPCWILAWPKPVLAGGLDLVATHTRYSVRELFVTLIALQRPELRAEKNVLARDRSVYCSALVQHLFRPVGLELAPGIEAKNTTPEDLFRNPVPHAAYLRQRELPRSAVRHRLKARVRMLKRKTRSA